MSRTNWTGDICKKVIDDGGINVMTIIPSAVLAR
jgi:hypothetical protein